MNFENEKSRSAENTHGSNENPIQNNNTYNNKQDQDIFEMARRLYNARTVELLFPGGTWKRNEYYILSPLRADNKIGSFSISDDGMFYDFATNQGGDLIDLVSLSRHVDKAEAARIIVQVAGGTIPDYPPRRTENTSGAIQEDPATSTIPKGEIPGYMPSNASAVWHYRDLNGKPWCTTARYDKPGVGKMVLPYYFDGQDWKNGNPIKNNRLLFNVDKLVGNNLPVLIVEGEKCASIQLEGFITVTWIGGCNAVEKSDFSPLLNRQVIIWPDADEPGMDAALKIKTFLPHAEILHIENRSKGWDIADAVAENIDPISFIKECPRIKDIDLQQTMNKHHGKGSKGRPRKSKQAMEILQKYPLCRYYDKHFLIKGNQAIKIGSRAYRDLITGEYFRTTGEPLTSVQIDEVISLHRAHAGESEKKQIYIRTAAPDYSISYIDINDGNNTIFEVDSNGWRTSCNPLVLFSRPANMEALPMPEHGGTVEPLKEIFNLERECDFKVIVAVLVYILRGRPHNKGSFPIIVATGIEGSAKTTFMKILKKLIDPGTPETRTPSKDMKDLFIAVNNVLVLSLDNISRIDRDMSDILCSIATGGGYSRKMNYTDDEEQTFTLCRPILLNGISFEKAPDLLSRSIIIELRPILQEERKTENEVWSLIDKLHPLILGALLTMLSNAIREELKMGNERFNLPRLADFGRFAIALERGNGWEVGQINSAFMSSYEAALGDKAEDNPIIPLIVSILEEKGYWRGSATNLLEAVNNKSTDSDRRLNVWPKTADKLGRHLKRNHNVYVTKGIMIKQIRDKQGRQWELSTRKKTEPAQENVPNFDDLPTIDTLL